MSRGRRNVEDLYDSYGLELKKSMDANVFKDYEELVSQRKNTEARSFWTDNFAMTDEDVDPVDKEGRTPLHIAARAGSEEAVTFLLSKPEYEIGAVDNNGETVLMSALHSVNWNVVDLILQHLQEEGEVSSIVRKTSKDRTLPLHLFIINFTPTDDNDPEWDHYFKVLDILLDEGEGRQLVRSRNLNGDTPLHIAISAPNPSTKVLRYLLDHNADVNQTNKFGETPVHYAVKTANVSLLNFLLRPQWEADLAVASMPQGKTAYELAVALGYTEIQMVLKETQKRSRSSTLMSKSKNSGSNKKKNKRKKSKSKKGQKEAPAPRNPKMKGLFEKRLKVREQKKAQRMEKKLNHRMSRVFGGKLTDNDIEELLRKCKDPTYGLEIRDRKLKLKNYKSCFYGNHFVDWLVENEYAFSKVAAVNLGNALIAKGLLESVSIIDGEFEDSKQLYSFSDTQGILKLEAYEDVDAEIEWKRREGMRGEDFFVKKIISPNLGELTGADYFETPQEILYYYLPLIFSHLRHVGISGKYSNFHFLDLVRSFVPRLTQNRLLKIRTYLLSTNVEFRFINTQIIYHSGAYIPQDQLQHLTEMMISGKLAEQKEVKKCWTEMEAAEILADTVKAGLTVMNSSAAKTPQKTTSLDIPILVDSFDMQSFEYLVTRLNTSPLADKDIIGTVGMQHPCVMGYDHLRPTKMTVEKIFTSNARPALISFKQLANGTFIKEDAWEEVKPRVVWKQGDNLMQDMGVELAFQVFNVIWRTCGDFPDVKKRPYIHTYQVFPTGIDVGFMELVDNAESFKNFDWEAWLKNSNDDMVQRMITSAAGSYIGGFVLGVRDRHWDNILIRNKHTMLHIDFGFLLGTQPPIDAPKLSISSGMKVALETLGVWETMIQLCLDAYKILRIHATEVIQACKLIFGQVLEWDHRIIEEHLIESLQLEESEDVALKVVKDLILGSSSAWQNWFKQFSHKTIDPMWYGLLRAHFPPAEAIMGKVETKTKKKMEAKKVSGLDGTKNVVSLMSIQNN